MQNQDWADVKAAPGLFPSLHFVIPFLCVTILYAGTVMPGMIAEKAGVRVGDIIVAVDLNPKISDAANSNTSKAKGRFDLSKETTKNRVDLFRKQNVSAMRLQIYRPENVDVAKQGQEFLDKSVRLSLSVIGLYKSNKGKAVLAKQRWRCSACRSLPPPSSVPTGDDEGGKSQSIYDQAFCCRSVVRRLAVEWYALPFVDEDSHQSDSVTAMESKARASGHSHDCYASLRRLDGMFSSIMEKHADVSAMHNSTISEGGSGEVSPFFYTPPSSSSRVGRKRLEWAPVELENDPFRLLCKGMGLLLSSVPALEGSGGDKDLLSEQKARLARHFLPLFSSFCLDSSMDWEKVQDVSSSDSPNKSVTFQGGPNTIVAHCPPFLRQPCSCCGVRPTNDSTHMVGFCSENCRTSFERGWLLDGTAGEIDSKAPSGEEEANDLISSKAEEKRQAYDINSSIVGSTILVLPDDALFDAVCKMVNVSRSLIFPSMTSFFTASFL